MAHAAIAVWAGQCLSPRNEIQQTMLLEKDIVVTAALSQPTPPT